MNFNLYKFLKDGLLRSDIHGLNADQTRYLNEHQNKELIRGLAVYNNIGSVGYFLGTVALYFFGHPELKIIPILWTSTLGIECILWAIANHLFDFQNHTKLIAVRAATVITTCLIFSGLIFDGLFRSTEFTPDYYVMAGIMLEIVGWGAAAAYLLYGRLVVLFLCLVPIITLLPAVKARSSNQIGLFLLSVIPTFCIGCFVIIDARIRRRLALTEYNAQQLSILNETLKRETIERELEIARTVQDAFQSPIGTKQSARHIINFFHVPHGILGGDWLAERELPDGRQVVVVADVTGKGIPAAMVVQCVQSLWAVSLAEREFDALKWMQNLNHSLFIMSKMRGTHSLSMGIMILDEQSCIYYSAGHVPMFLIRNIDDPLSISPILCNGSVLGLQDQATFRPKEIYLPIGESYVLMMGTDGILDWKTRRSSRSILRIVLAALDEGISAIARHPVQDDKIMILIRPSRKAAKIA